MFASLRIDEITQNRHIRKIIGTPTTTLYSVMSLLYFFVQVLTLISAADVNHSSGQLLQSVLQEAHISTTSDFAYLESVKAGGRLRICSGIAASTQVDECPVFFPVQDADGPIATTTKRGEEYTMIPVFQQSNLTAFMMLEASDPGEVISVPPACLRVLEWPYQTLMQIRRTDVTVASFQAWLLILSVVAIFCESTSHVASTFLMHIFALAWSSSQIAATIEFRSDYRRLIAGACDGVDLLEGYFNSRMSYEIAMTVVNFVTLLASAYLTWRLVLVYGWANVKESATSPIIRKAYLFALGLSAVMQLAVFFQAASIALWLDEITKHIMGATSNGMIAYLVLYIALILFLVPWFYLAWSGIREESKRRMIGFFVLCVLYVVGVIGMFVSDTFRQTVIYWSFFRAMFVTSCIFVVVSIVFALLCQLNFGIGLHRYLDTSGNGGFHESSSIDDNGDLEKAMGGFIGSLPSEKPLQREASVSSNSSTLRSEHSYGYTKGILSGRGLVAAEPGAIKILPPVPAATNPSESPRSKGIATPLTPLRKYGRDLWGRTKRHESAMSFGHMDASKLNRGSEVPPTGTQRLPMSLGGPLSLNVDGFSRDSRLETPSFAQSQPPQQRVDSMGSIYSIDSNKPRLVLVTAL